MERVLAVVDTTDVAKELVREAGSLAEGMDAKLVLVHVTTEEAYTARRGAMESLPNSAASYTHDDARRGATEFARDIGDEVFAGTEVEYDAVGALGDEATEVLGVAEEYDCDYVFLTGRQRSPAGKALFGDTTQRVVLDFDGYVTVKTE
ncbi:universal stress protein [Candidatus Halobonum tyrrellensis]|uniref:UspA domain-containing protein n=1 Tax=Candidatus Halobonum tyrrellensis G22 TaxID=1324957 RepID=V4J3S1_9EURY|nr:universal stress protein [Candidatus Halobonum tyrrellensis]ESP90027.1 UspA domain-containing protein [Candidatus Halobonum tyrrellensis G22]